MEIEKGHHTRSEDVAKEVRKHFIHYEHIATVVSSSSLVRVHTKPQLLITASDTCCRVALQCGKCVNGTHMRRSTSRNSSGCSWTT